MINIIKSFLVAIIMSVLLISGTTFAAPTAQNLNAAINTADDESTFVGVWRGTAQFQSVNWQREYVFQPNGKFSMTIDCGSYHAWFTGDWRIVQPGTMRLEIADYFPKKYVNGNVYVPEGETVGYRFINSNQLRLDSVRGAVMSDLYRAQ